MTKEEYQKIYQKIYRKKNKDKSKEYSKKHYNNNKDEINKKAKEAYKIDSKYSEEYRNKNKNKIKEWKKLYYERNKVKIKNDVKRYQKSRKNTDPLFKFKSNIRTMINNLLKNRRYTKQSRTFDIVGCSFGEFIIYIEKQFESWMDWDNYGLYNGELNYGWDLDHKEPIALAKTEEDVIRLNHYTNLQPLCSYTNRYIKRDN